MDSVNDRLRRIASQPLYRVSAALFVGAEFIREQAPT